MRYGYETQQVIKRGDELLVCDQKEAVEVSWPFIFDQETGLELIKLDITEVHAVRPRENVSSIIIEDIPLQKQDIKLLEQ